MSHRGRLIWNMLVARARAREEGGEVDIVAAAGAHTHTHTHTHTVSSSSSEIQCESLDICSHHRSVFQRHRAASVSVALKGMRAEHQCFTGASGRRGWERTVHPRDLCSTTKRMVRRITLHHNITQRACASVHHCVFTTLLSLNASVHLQTHSSFCMLGFIKLMETQADVYRVQNSSACVFIYFLFSSSFKCKWCL